MSEKKAPKKDKNWLQKLGNKLSPEKAMLSMVQSMLPNLAERLNAMSKPKAEGGLLQEGEEKICYIITEHELEMKVLICPLIFDRETGKKILGTPIQNTSLTEILSNEPGA